MNKQRLVRLERAVNDFSARPCTVCWGTPIAAVEVELEWDPDGPGTRRVGQQISERDRGRVTDDFHCRRCGKRARIILLERIKRLEATDNIDGAEEDGP